MRIKFIFVFTFALFLAFFLVIYVTRTSRFNSSQLDGTNVLESYKNVHHLLKSRYEVLNDGTVIHIGHSFTTFKAKYIFAPQDICEDYRNDAVKLLVVVESKASNFEKRHTIRNTWALKALQDALNYRVIFILASDLTETNKYIERESWTHDDIVQLEFEETYSHVALKSVALLKWALFYCKQANFIFKTDDDLFLHVPNLIQSFTKELGLNNTEHILCHENKVRKILRSPKLNLTSASALQRHLIKYAVENLPGIYYPHYCAGFGYGFTKAVARSLYAATATTPYIFLEDVYITGFCREKAGLKIRNTATLTLRPPVTLQGVCSFKDGRINSQELNEEEIRQLWKSINTRGYKCPKFVGFVH